MVKNTECVSHFALSYFFLEIFEKDYLKRVLDMHLGICTHAFCIPDPGCGIGSS